MRPSLRKGSELYGPSSEGGRRPIMIATAMAGRSGIIQAILRGRSIGPKEGRTPGSKPASWRIPRWRPCSTERPPRWKKSRAGLGGARWSRSSPVGAGNCERSFSDPGRRSARVSDGSSGRAMSHRRAPRLPAEKGRRNRAAGAAPSNQGGGGGRGGVGGGGGAAPGGGGGVLAFLLSLGGGEGGSRPGREDGAQGTL